MPTTPALKIGVAGVGVMGRNHARVLSDVRDVTVAAVFDPDAATAEGVAGLYGATPEGGWSNELKPEDCVHTLIAVHTDEGAVGLGSVFSSSALVHG